MQSAAYWIALLTVVMVPPFLLFWAIIHPFTRFWRRVGPGIAYTAALAAVAAMMAAIYALREPLLRVGFGFRPPLAILGGVLWLGVIAIGLLVKREFGLRVLVGIPQLAPDPGAGKLVTTGIYAHLRHPRYVQVGLGLAAIALFANYLAVYLTLAAYFPLVYLVVLLEERELRERFGEEYERYSREVPRFVPRLRGRKRERG